MSAGVLPVPVSIVLCAALLWALGALLMRLRRKFDVTLAAWALAAGGLLLLQAENAFGWRGAPHAALSMFFLALAIGAVLANFLPRRADGGLPAALPLAGLAVAFSAGDGLRALLSGLLLIYFIAVFIGAVRGAEPETASDDARAIGRPPLRRPDRVRGAREIALAIVAGALALQSGVTLLPQPQPDAPATAEPDAAPESAEADTASPAPAEPAEPTAPAEPEKPPEAPTPGSKPDPLAAPSAARPDALTDAKIYRTRAGDSLRAIAARLYGRPDMLKALAKANPRIKPDDRLPAGREIRLPVPPTRR